MPVASRQLPAAFTHPILITVYMKKPDGFPGQISFVMPEKIEELIRKNSLISDLYLTDIGYYPHLLTSASSGWSKRLERTILLLKASILCSKI